MLRSSYSFYSLSVAAAVACCLAVSAVQVEWTRRLGHRYMCISSTSASCGWHSPSPSFSLPPSLALLSGLRLLFAALVRFLQQFRSRLRMGLETSETPTEREREKESARQIVQQRVGGAWAATATATALRRRFLLGQREITYTELDCALHLASASTSPSGCGRAASWSHSNQKRSMANHG